MSTIGENIKRLREIKNLSQKEVANFLGVRSSSISNYEKGVSEPDLDKIQRLSKYFGVSISELLQLKESGLKLNLPLEKGVPYYDIDVTATITESFSDVKESPEFYVDFKPFNDCTAYLPIFGDSMYPAFASGEIIAVKKINNKDILQWGEAHLIITNALANNMKTVKLIYPHEDPEKLILRASNPNFKGDVVIPKESILNIYIVKGKITRKQL